MKASLSNYGQAPRKVRLVTELIKGKSVAEAMTLLTFNDKRASNPMKKLLLSAVANAEQNGERREDLVVKNITVDKGIVISRYMPRAFGRASTLNRRKSHVTVTLGKAEAKAPRKHAAKKK